MRNGNRTTHPLALPSSLTQTPMTTEEWAVIRSAQSDPDRLLLLVRFWSKVQIGAEDECWEWRSPLIGRPVFSWRGQDFVAARAAYELAIGPLSPSLFACHSCDNGQCVNPRHLFPGTLQENKADHVAKGLHARGERLKRSSLTADKVREIRRRYAAGGISQEALGREFGVCQAAVGQIVHKRVWQHVE